MLVLVLVVELSKFIETFVSHMVDKDAQGSNITACIGYIFLGLFTATMPLIRNILLISLEQWLF